MDAFLISSENERNDSQLQDPNFENQLTQILENHPNAENESKEDSINIQTRIEDIHYKSLVEELSKPLDLDHANVTVYLKGEIERWLSAKANRRLSLLSRLSGVPYATLNRLHHGVNEPNFENLFNLALVILDRDQQINLVKKCYPRFFTWIELLIKKVDVQS